MTELAIPEIFKSEIIISYNSLIVIGTVVLISFIIILMVLEKNLFNNIKELIADVLTVLSNVITDLKAIQNFLIEKTPQDLYILQIIMLYLERNDLTEMPNSMFEKKDIDEKQFQICFTNPAQKLIIEILARYVKCNFDLDFPEKVYGATSNYATEIETYRKTLLYYFSKANRMLGL